MALMNTFRRGNSRHVEPAEFMEWIEQVANVSGATSLHGKAAKYAGLLVESECYETAELLASVTEQQLIAINVPRGHAAVLAYFLSGPPTQGASPSTSHGDSGGTTTTSEATNISGQMIGDRSDAQKGRSGQSRKKGPTTDWTNPTAEAVKDVKYRYWVAEEMGDRMNWPAEILVDNAAGIAFQQSINSSTKLKGMIQLRDTWVQEMKDSKYIKAVKVSTDTNVADLLTKCLGATIRNRLIGVVEQTASLIATSRFRGHVGRGRRLRTIRP